MISLQSFGLVELLTLILVVWAAAKAGQFLWSRRRQWTIADWFAVTFWIAVLLAFFARH